MDETEQGDESLSYQLSVVDFSRWPKTSVFARIETDAGIVGCGAGDQRNWRKGTEGLLAFRGPQVEFRLCQSTLVRD